MCDEQTKLATAQLHKDTRSCLINMAITVVVAAILVSGLVYLIVQFVK